MRGCRNSDYTGWVFDCAHSPSSTMIYIYICLIVFKIRKRRTSETVETKRTVSLFHNCFHDQCDSSHRKLIKWPALHKSDISYPYPNLLKYISFPITQLLVFICYSNEAPKRLVYVNRSHDPHLTTVYYPEQIGAYKNSIGDPSSTTPTNFKLNKTDEDVEIDSSVDESRITSMQLRSDEVFLPPPNHRRQYTEGRLYAYTPNNVKPSGFKVNNLSTTAAALPQLPKDYVGNVNSIGDILDQVHGPNVYPTRAHMDQPMNRGLSIRVQGTYRQKQMNDAQSDHTEDSISSQSIKNPRQLVNSEPTSDPFYPYKPTSLSDINLMATKQFRFAPFVRQSRVKPVKVAATQVSDAEIVYNQILAASSNRQHRQPSDISRKETSDRKPFSLMLDVYPANDDDVSTTTKKPQPNKFKRPLPVPMDISAINNNLQYDQSYYNHIRFPQLQPYRAPHMHQLYDDMYFRRYMASRQSPWWQRAPANVAAAQLQQSNERHQTQLNDNNQPSQITVHLNLFPGRKSKAPKNKVTSVEILGRSEEDNPNLFSPNSNDSQDKEAGNSHMKNGFIDMPPFMSFLSSPLVHTPNATVETNANIRSNDETTTEATTMNNEKSATDFDYTHGTSIVPVTTIASRGLSNSNISYAYGYDRINGLHREISDEKDIAYVQPIQMHESIELHPSTRPNELVFNYPTMSSGENGLLTSATSVLEHAFEPMFIPTQHRNDDKVMLTSTTPASFDGLALFERPAKSIQRHHRSLLTVEH